MFFKILSPPRTLFPQGYLQSRQTYHVSKYADHLPLYHLEGILARHNPRFSRTTLTNWIIRLGTDVLLPLITLLKEHQLSGDYLQLDETRLQVLKDAGKAATSDNWIWLIRGGPAEQKRQQRQQLSQLLLEDFHQWLAANQNRIPKDSLIYEAIRYALNQCPTLTGYCEDGRLHISNALTKNAIRPFAVGRRNWLFADTARGAKASATCYSLIETAKANGLEPLSYIGVCCAASVRRIRWKNLKRCCHGT